MQAIARMAQITIMIFDYARDMASPVHARKRSIRWTDRPADMRGECSVSCMSPRFVTSR
jgi:hypothetical protein